MGVLRPVRMAKIGFLGLKEDRDTILTVLHDLRIAQVEPVSPDVLAQMLPDRGSELQRRVGDEALRFRGLKSALPPLGRTPPRQFASLEEVLLLAQSVPIDAEVTTLKREDDQLQTLEKSLDDTFDLLGRMAFYPDRLELLHARSIVTLFGEGRTEAVDGWRARLPPELLSQFLDGVRGRTASFLVTVRPADTDLITRTAQAASVQLRPVPALAGTAAEERVENRHRRSECVARREQIAERLGAISRDWFPVVASVDEALAVEARKFDLYPKMASGRAAFAVEAWVPERDVDRLARAVDQAAGGRTFLYRSASAQDPPTLMDNPPGFRWFEFFIRFYSIPNAKEWDPTLVFALVFPVFFGFMIGDWGYGLVILLISVWMIAGFPGGGKLPASIRGFIKTIMGPSTLRQLALCLVPGAVIALAWGLYLDSFFGYGVLNALVGYVPRVRPNTNLGQLLLLAGFIGLGMVTLGFAFGALKEYFHHHYRGAVGKSGGIVFAWGVTFFGLGVLRHITTPTLSNPSFYLLVAGAILFVAGEGLQNGPLGLIEVVSHVLSYTRLVGILLASVILAVLINSVAVAEFHSGAVGVAIGVAVLVIGQGFNVVLAVFEPTIQGMRLMFVEYFSKFYEGGGRPFQPFGADRTHTLPYRSPSPPPPTGAPAPVGPPA
ncbi:MAG: hypothetical protein L3J95_03870 [Thermoplasmata archaeon]|nr:hypothetical protein [Thermoplasmata archaeon]MCI4359545.1 hypothetical protein [Thermoplasmata archaeon]